MKHRALFIEPWLINSIFSEARTSSPVRVVRDGRDGQSVTAAGLFPAGEGAGYAGGIVSAAVDGIQAADKVVEARAEAMRAIEARTREVDAR